MEGKNWIEGKKIQEIKSVLTWLAYCPKCYTRIGPLDESDFEGNKATITCKQCGEKFVAVRK